MVQFEIACWNLEVDPARTRAYYQTSQTHSSGCPCENCLNFVLAYKRLPAGLIELCDRLGIDPKKRVGEVWEYGDNPDGSHHYGGLFHIVGRILNGRDYGDSISGLVPYKGIEVSFTEKLSLLADDFPQPAIQLNFEADIPWVL